MGKDEEEQTESVPAPIGPQPLSYKIKILYTICILVSNITLGCALNSFSPALEDLRRKYGTTVDEISKVFTVNLICYCIGALLSAFYYNYINRQLGVIACLAGMAISMIATPHCPSQTVFFVIGGILGFAVGGYDAAQIVWMMEIWQSKAGPYVQAQHFFYALGTNIPPLLLAPFLSDEGDDDEDTTTNSTLSTTEWSTTTLEPEESKLALPFSIVGGLNVLACSFQIILFIFFRYKTPPIEEELENNNREVENKSLEAQAIDEDNVAISRNDSQDALDSTTEDEINIVKKVNWPRIRLISCAALFLGAYQGMEMCSMQFLPTYAQHSDLKLSESKSSIVLSGLTGAFAAGRGLGILIILKVPPVLMLCGNLTLILAANLIFLIWAKSNITMLWVAAIVIGAGFSTMYASFCVFIERHLVFTNAVGSAMVVVGTTIAAIYPVIVGNSIEENVVVFTYTTFFSIAVCSIMLAINVKLTYRSTGRLL